MDEIRTKGEYFEAVLSTEDGILKNRTYTYEELEELWPGMPDRIKQGKPYCAADNKEGEYQILRLAKKLVMPDGKTMFLAELSSPDNALNPFCWYIYISCVLFVIELFVSTHMYILTGSTKQK